jgi:hypothetical protein
MSAQLHALAALTIWKISRYPLDITLVEPKYRSEDGAGDEKPYHWRESKAGDSSEAMKARKVNDFWLYSARNPRLTVSRYLPGEAEENHGRNLGGRVGDQANIRTWHFWNVSRKRYRLRQLFRFFLHRSGLSISVYLKWRKEYKACQGKGVFKFHVRVLQLKWKYMYVCIYVCMYVYMYEYVRLNEEQASGKFHTFSSDKPLSRFAAGTYTSQHVSTCYTTHLGHAVT